ncbi:cAMP receptor protein [Novipirellula galeiformis]|uniref:cAMP receptor protein n=1 Tax=Novipirellula galeiformis TaxID=2528004 RepID=A0A5C6CJ96_9BACT|nr:Crp/Fnr family transcriptional regulator [Novipirellula galeiformis]TWU23226.1 cAMP receptor protein [Novipirellula galeiformis]
MPEKLWHLKNCDIFGKLLPEEIKRLESRSRSRSFPARSPVYLPSEKADSVFLLAKGLVKVCNLTSDGKQSILAFVEPGELFGELAIFAEAARDEYVEAVDAATVVMIPAEELQQLMSHHNGVALEITKMVGLRRHRIERRLKNLMFLSNRDRLIHLLLDLAEQFGVCDSEGIRLRIKLAHQELANLMGSTRETVTILLGHLKSEGLIHVGRRKIVLVNTEQLAASVDRRIPVLR